MRYLFRDLEAYEVPSFQKEAGSPCLLVGVDGASCHTITSPSVVFPIEFEVSPPSKYLSDMWVSDLAYFFNEAIRLRCEALEGAARAQGLDLPQMLVFIRLRPTVVDDADSRAVFMKVGIALVQTPRVAGREAFPAVRATPDLNFRVSELNAAELAALVDMALGF